MAQLYSIYILLQFTGPCRYPRISFQTPKQSSGRNWGGTSFGTPTVTTTMSASLTAFGTSGENVTCSRVEEQNLQLQQTQTSHSPPSTRSMQGSPPSSAPPGRREHALAPANDALLRRQGTSKLMLSKKNENQMNSSLFCRVSVNDDLPCTLPREGSIRKDRVGWPGCWWPSCYPQEVM